KVDGVSLEVRNTPAGRNSRPFGERPACAGNTNCIPICPIQAKYDASVTLNQAMDTGKVQLCVNTVATEVVLGADGAVESIAYVQYDPAVLHDPTHPNPSITGQGSVRGKRFVIAAHAIETPKLLLSSTGKLPAGVANSSGQVGKNLMDHPLYLAWAATSEPVYGYRGPLATSGIENVRDGGFRKERGAFRVEIGNEGWNFPKSDPYNTTLDMVLGLNQTRLNPPNPFPQTPVTPNPPQFGAQLTKSLNAALTRQLRVAMLVEQTPEETNTVTLSDAKDWLGIRRPKINYGLSDYTKRGFVAAAQAATDLFKAMGATEYTEPPAPDDPSGFDDPSGATFDVDGKKVPRRFKMWGSGHVVGTYRMGSDAKTSVVDKFQRSWDHKNLFLVGSGVFPTVATANPTLTIAALAFWAADTLVQDLAPAHHMPR
ncbi:MAG TPA: GMC family oxidoreductase, partial [Xanthomonadales bacterium]|nr:GMC family oxidoreductase [Xanthomonadales bacterium]